MTVDRCCWPSPGASAPAWRWPSRPWRGWCGPSSRPCTATTRSSTTRSSCERFEARASSSSTTSPRCPRAPDHAVGPRLGPRGRRRGPGPRRLRGRFGVPAGHQGAPRGEGARRQGLPHRLRRPRGPRGGGRHHGRRPRSITGSRASPRSRGAPPFDEPVALLAQTTLSHRDWEGVADATRERYPDCGRPAAATCASPPPTASRR
jgi:hypothetical protein